MSIKIIQQFFLLIHSSNEGGEQNIVKKNAQHANTGYVFFCRPVQCELPKKAFYVLNKYKKNLLVLCIFV